MVRNLVRPVRAARRHASKASATLGDRMAVAAAKVKGFESDTLRSVSFRGTPCLEFGPRDFKYNLCFGPQKALKMVLAIEEHGVDAVLDEIVKLAAVAEASVKDNGGE